MLGGGRYTCSSFRFVPPLPLLWPQWFEWACLPAVTPHPPGHDHDLRVKLHSDALNEKHGATAGEWCARVGNRRNISKTMLIRTLAFCSFNITEHYWTNTVQHLHHIHTHTLWALLSCTSVSGLPPDPMFPRIPLRKGRCPGHRDRLLHSLHQCLRQAGPERVHAPDRNHPRAPSEEDVWLPHSGQRKTRVVSQQFLCRDLTCYVSVWMMISEVWRQNMKSWNVIFSFKQ